MNKVFRVVWNDALALWTVASELGRGHSKAHAVAGAAGAAVTLALATMSMPAAADCVATGAAIACSSAGGTQGTTVGTG
ncbi:Extended Signal Peptide of Type V secretion system, partial [Variovorax sp. OV084]